MQPKYGKHATRKSVAPQFDELISILQSAQTFHSDTPHPISTHGMKVESTAIARTFPLMRCDDIIAARKANQRQDDNKDDEKSSIMEESSQSLLSGTAEEADKYGGPTDSTVYPVSNSTNRYKTDLKGQETETMQMVMAEMKQKGLNSARLYRAPPQYYQEKIEWRRDILKAPHIKYLCKSLLMKNTRCTRKDCEDPTNSLYYLVIFQYVTRINSEQMMKFVRMLHGKLGKKKFKFRLASSEENAIETGFTHNSVTPIGMKNKKIPIILSKRVLELDHFWMGGGEFDVKLAVDVNEFRNVYRPYVADIVYEGWIDPNENLEDEQQDDH